MPRGRPFSSVPLSISSASAAAAAAPPAASVDPGGPFSRDRPASAPSSPVSAPPSSSSSVVVGDSYVPHADWDLTATTVVNHDVEYPCCPGRRYSDVTYAFRLLRRPTSSSSSAFYRAGQQQGGPRDVRSRDDITAADDEVDANRDDTAGLSDDGWVEAGGPDSWWPARGPGGPRLTVSSSGRRDKAAGMLLPLVMWTSCVLAVMCADFGQSAISPRTRR